MTMSNNPFDELLDENPGWLQDDSDREEREDEFGGTDDADGNGSPWDPDEYTFVQGKLRWNGIKRSPKLTEFDVRLLRHVTIREGDGSTSQLYEVQFVLNEQYNGIDKVVTLQIPSDARKSSKALQEFLTERLGVEFFVYEPYGWRHLNAAISYLANKRRTYTIEHVYGYFGWVFVDDVHTAYLLSSNTGAITKDGINQSVRIYDGMFAKVSSEWARYGVGVRQPVNDGERSRAAAFFLDTLRVHDALLPMIVQVLGGPLCPFLQTGGTPDYPFLNIMGDTGMLKSSMALVALSLMGDFVDGGSPETWISTNNTIRQSLHYGRHLTLLIDDYKKNRVGGEPTDVIHSYANRQGRGRLQSDQQRQKAQIPAGLAMSTAEDKWEGYESVTARTLTLYVSRLEQAEFDAFSARLSYVQQTQKTEKLLGVIGYEWIEWLARQPAQSIRLFLATRHAHYRAAISTRHARITSTLATLGSFGDLIEQFLRKRFPEIADEYHDRWQVALKSIVQTNQDEADDSAELEPFVWGLHELQQAFSVGQVYFVPRSSLDSIPLGTPSRTAEPIGYYDEVNVYLTRQMAYDWFSHRAGQARRDLHFSWGAFLHGARSRLGPYLIDGVDQRASYNAKARGHAYRFLVIPRDRIEDPEVRAEAMTIEFDATDVIAAADDIVFGANE